MIDDHGISARSVARRIRTGALRPVRRDVYVVTAIETEHSTVAALAMGVEGSVISHRSAASIQGMALAVDVPTVTVLAGRRLEVAGCRIAQTRFLPNVDRGITSGLPVTSPARTLCDLAVELRPGHLHQLVQQQTLEGTPSMPALVACHQSLARRGRGGTVAMRAVLSELTDDQPFPASQLEMLVARGLHARGVVGLRRQFAPPWYDGLEGIVDFADPEGQTIIEADGRTWHTLDRHAARDRQRNRQALANGWVVIRVGWAELVERTEQTLDELVEAIAVRRRSRL